MASTVSFVDRVKQLFGGKPPATAAALPAVEADAKPQPGVVGAAKEIATEFSNDDGMTQAAALAFYTGLSIAPLLSIAVWITQLVTLKMVDPQKTTDAIQGVAAQVIGPAAAAPIKELIGPAAKAADEGWGVTGLISILFLIFTASGVFGQLQSSLNIMWNVKASAQTGSGIWALVQKRLLSFGMLFTLLFLMLISMVASFLLEAINTYVSSGFGGGEDGPAKPILWGLQAVNLAVTFVIATGVFTLLFKYLPDVKVPWRDTIFGAAITAFLFMLGKYVLAMYLGRGSYESSYGAAIGSFVALLVWVYYSSVILFIGAETTQVYARRRGHEPVAEDHAVKLERTEKVMPHPQPVGKVTYGPTTPHR